MILTNSRPRSSYASPSKVSCAKANLALLAIAIGATAGVGAGLALVSQPTIYADLSNAAQTPTQHLTASPARASPR